MNKRNSNCLARFVNLLQPLRGTGEWRCARSGRCWVLALVLLVAMLLSATTRPVSCEPQVVGYVEECAPTATLLRDGETSRMSPGMQLLSCDKVTSLVNGRINIVLAEGAMIEIAPNTCIILNGYTADRARPWLLTHRFELVNGWIRVEDSLWGSRVEMRVNDIVVRASRFGALYADGFFDLYGVSEVALGADTVNLPKGKGLLVSPNGNFSVCDGIPPSLLTSYSGTPLPHLAHRDNRTDEVKIRIYRDMNEIVFAARNSRTQAYSPLHSVWWDIREGNIEPVPSLFGPVLRVKAKPGKLRVGCTVRSPYQYMSQPEIVIAVCDEAINRPPSLKTEPNLLALTRHPFCPEALAEDPEGHPVSITWKVTPSEGFVEQSASDTGPDIVFSKPGTYEIKWTAEDLFGGVATQTSCVRVVEPTGPPVCGPQPNITTTVGIDTTLPASGCHDPDGVPVWYNYEITDCPEESGLKGTKIRTYWRDNQLCGYEYSFPVPGVYRIKLTCSSVKGASKPVEFSVIVGEAKAERVSLPLDLRATVGDSHSRRFSVDDQYGGFEGDCSFASGPQVSAQSNWLVFRHPGTYRFRLRVHADEQVEEAIQTVVVSRPNIAPEAAMSGPARGSVGAPSVFTVSEVYDADGDPLDLIWTASSDADGTVAATHHGLSFPFVPKAAGTYTITLVASDGVDSSKPVYSTFYALKALTAPAPRVIVTPDRPVRGDLIRLSAAASAPGQGGVLLFGWKQLAGPPVKLDPSNSVLCSFIAPFAGLYRFELTVLEEGGLSARKSVEVRVAAGNLLPVAVAPTAVWAVAGGGFVLDGSSSHDPDGDQLTLTWELRSAYNPWDRSQFTSPVLNLKAVEPGQYKFALIADDGTGKAEALTTVTVEESAPVDALVSPASLTVEPGAKASFTCTTAAPESSFRWAQVRGLKVEFQPDTQALTISTLFPGLYEFRCTVSSAGGFSRPASAVLVVRTPAEKPEFSVFAPENAAPGSEVTMSTALLSGSSKGLVYSWSQVGGPIAEIVADAGDGAEARFVPTAPGIYDIEVAASVMGRATTTRRVRIEVTSPLPPPRADAGVDLFCEVGYPFTLDGGQSRQAGGYPLSFTWTQLAGPQKLIEATTARKVDIVPQKVGVYRFALTVSNGYETSAAEVTVRVRERNQAPVASLEARPGLTLVRGSSFVLDASASRDPEGDPVRFCFSGPAEFLPYGSNDTDMSCIFVQNLDAGVHEFRVVVWDNFGEQSNSSRVRVTVIDPVSATCTPSVLATDATLGAFALLSAGAEAYGREFIASQEVLDAWPPERSVQPFRWVGNKEEVPDLLAGLLSSFWHDAAKSRADKPEDQRDWILLTRNYAHLADQRSKPVSGVFSGITSEDRLEQLAQFCDKLLLPATNHRKFSVSRNGMQVIAQLPDRGAEILARYIDASASISPTMPCPEGRRQLEADAPEKPAYTGSDVATLGQLASSMAEHWGERIELHQAIPSGLQLPDELRKAVCGGWLPLSQVTRALREHLPQVVLVQEEDDRLVLVPVSRQLMARSFENVWDSGKLVVFATPLPRPDGRFASIIEEIQLGNDLLKALWTKDDPAVFCGMDPLGRVVLYNSPLAIDYTLRYLWQRVMAESFPEEEPTN